MRLSGSEGRDEIDTTRHGWTKYPAGSRERIEALYLDAVKRNMPLSHLPHYCGLTLEEASEVTRRLLAQQRLSPTSKYAKLRSATRNSPGRRRGGSQEDA